MLAGTTMTRPSAARRGVRCARVARLHTRARHPLENLLASLKSPSPSPPPLCAVNLTLPAMMAQFLLLMVSSFHPAGQDRALQPRLLRPSPATGH